MSLIVRDENIIMADDRFITKVGGPYIRSSSGKKLFIHPECKVVLGVLGDYVSEDTCEEILYLAHNTLSVRKMLNESSRLPVTLQLLPVEKFINTAVFENKKETTFFVFLKELTIQFSQKTCELYVPDIVVGSGQYDYLAARRLGYSPKMSFLAAHNANVYVGRELTWFETSRFISYFEDI